MQRAQASVAHLRSWCALATRGQRIVYTTHRESAHPCLPQLRQPSRNKTAILLIRVRAIEEITGLNKEIYPLAKREIRRLLKGMAQTLPVLLAFARPLTWSCIAKMVISGKHKGDYPVSLLIGGWSRASKASFFHILF